VIVADTSVTPSGVDQTRARILAATRKLYASKGSRGTTTREVAERANVNEATLFRHFGTKQQLLAEMLDHYSSVAEFPQMLEEVRSFPTTDEQLCALARRCVESMQRKEDLIRTSMAEEFTNPQAMTCAWQAAAAARVAIGEFFEEKVAAGELQGDGHWLARMFMSLFFAYVMSRKIWGDLDSPTEASIQKIVEVFMNGARGR